ncbi:MAG: Rieske 2Fe-2S domain-containing protein [Anaerolineales bacterium]|nr:Rieske 2Fe-2S domain-containing protein [Anaerolineales bacterium]
MSEEGHGHGLSRRAFVTGVVSVLGGVIAAIIGLPAIGYLISPALQKRQSDEWVPLGNVEDLPEGVPTLFSFTRTKQVGWERTANSYGVYVERKSENDLNVFSNICTHLSCRVKWKEDEGEFICPCHDGHFAKDGAIISGPQPRPLDRFEHRIEDDGTLMIHLVEG